MRAITILRWLSFAGRWLAALSHVLFNVLVEVDQIFLYLQLLAYLHCKLHVFLDLLLFLLFLHELLQLAWSPLLGCLSLFDWVTCGWHNNGCCSSWSGLGRQFLGIRYKISLSECGGVAIIHQWACVVLLVYWSIHVACINLRIWSLWYLLLILALLLLAQP